MISSLGAKATKVRQNIKLSTKIYFKKFHFYAEKCDYLLIDLIIFDFSVYAQMRFRSGKTVYWR